MPVYDCLFPIGSSQISHLQIRPDIQRQQNGSIAQAQPQSGFLGDGLGKLWRRRNKRGGGSLEPGDGAGRARSAPAHSALSPEEPQSRVRQGGVSVVFGPASPVNPASSDCTPGGDVRGAREEAAMPVGRVTQLLGFLLISEAWPGGAAVTMEARSRRAARVGWGGAGPGRPRGVGARRVGLGMWGSTRP